MKRRGARDIPDFSNKKNKGPVAPGTPPRQTTPAVTPRDRVVKPQSTSSKSGRRGS